MFKYTQFITQRVLGLLVLSICATAIIALSQNTHAQPQKTQTTSQNTQAQSQDIQAKPQKTQAKRRALLVGVSNYHNLDDDLQLYGPKNDVLALRDMLTAQGFDKDDIMILANRVDQEVPHAIQPTRSHIFKALNQLKDQAKRGDMIVIYLSGLGVQMPVSPNSPNARYEPDGMHEAFLPADVASLDDRKSATRAIFDYEIVKIVDEIIERGAFVWGISDVCHAVSLMDNSALTLKLQSNNHRDPHIHSAQTEEGSQSRGAEIKQRDPSSQSDQRGSSVFFYAAQAWELTPEVRLPLNDPQRKSYGLFSYMIRQVFKSHTTPISYRQLMVEITAKYLEMKIVTVRPVATGDALDRIVFAD